MTSNKQIVHTFYKEVIGQHNEEVADQLLADDYIQHNPMVKTGKAGFFETLEFLKQMPKPANPKNPIIRTIGEGDYVALHLSVDIAGTKKVIIDLFRLEDGKLAEHWDAIEDHPDSTLNGHTMIDGATEVQGEGNASVNKERLNSYYRAIWIDKRHNRLPEFVHKDLIQHSPDVANGVEGLQEYLTSGNLSIHTVHRIIGEGNFVVAQLEGQFNDKPCVVYEILRIDDGLIAEQWRVKQLIPENMLHENGMI